MKKWYILGGSFAVAFLAILLSGPKVAENLRPLKNERMQEGFDVYTDKETGKSKGFGFVEMEDATSASNAIEGLNGKAMHDRNLRVSKAQERDRSEQRGGSGDRREGNRSYGSDNGYRSGPKSPF